MGSTTDENIHTRPHLRCCVWSQWARPRRLDHRRLHSPWQRSAGSMASPLELADDGAIRACPQPDDHWGHSNPCGRGTAAARLTNRGVGCYLFSG